MLQISNYLKLKQAQNDVRIFSLACIFVNAEVAKLGVLWTTDPWVFEFYNYYCPGQLDLLFQWIH